MERLGEEVGSTPPVSQPHSNILHRVYFLGSLCQLQFQFVSVQDSIVSLGKALSGHHLVGLMVIKASASRAEDPGFESRLRRDFSGSSHTSDLKFGTPVATLPGAWRYRVSGGTGRPGVSIL